MFRGRLHVGDGDIRLFLERISIDEIWGGYRAVLAAELDEATWVRVQDAVTQVWFAAAAPMPMPAEILQDTADALRAAQQALRPRATPIPLTLDPGARGGAPPADPSVE